MGSGLSHEKTQTSVRVGRSVAEVVKMMMPVYYIEDDTSEVEIARARATWNMILNDTSEHFITMKGRGVSGYQQQSCVSLYYDSFYDRLFDVHPMARPMFSSGLKSQGKFLVKMVSLALSLFDQDEKFREILVKLAEVHNERGVKAVEYGIVGEVMFWSLRKCLGPVYDSDVHRVWVKIFSRMLKIMVPVAVSFELRCGDAQIERLRCESSSKKKGVVFENVEGGAPVVDPEGEASTDPDAAREEKTMTRF